MYVPHDLWNSTVIKYIVAAKTNHMAGILYVCVCVENYNASLDTPKFCDVTPRVLNQCARSYNEWNILSTRIPLVSCLSALQFLRYGHLKYCLWKSKVKIAVVVKDRVHIIGPALSRFIFFSFYINKTIHPRPTAFSNFDLRNLKSRM